MKEGVCGYCEDPLPGGAQEGFCDELCKDLHARSVDAKGRMRKPKHLGNAHIPAHPSSSKDVKDQKKRFDPVLPEDLE